MGDRSRGFTMKDMKGLKVNSKSEMRKWGMNVGTFITLLNNNFNFYNLRGSPRG